MEIAITIGVVVVVIGLLAYTFISNNKIKKNGIEAEAEVVRIDVRVTEKQNADGSIETDTDKTYIVRYKTQTGDEVEARLNNPGLIGPNEGDIIKIKYLPEKPNRVVRVK